MCMGVAAPAAGFCLSSPDQRSAAQLSHLVRHRICSVLQQWCEVQAPLTTLDPPQRGLHVSREQNDRAGLRNGSRHRGHGAKGP